MRFNRSLHFYAWHSLCTPRLPIFFSKCKNKSYTFVWFSARSVLEYPADFIVSYLNERKQISDEISDLLFLSRGYAFWVMIGSNEFTDIYFFFCTLYIIQSSLVWSLSCKSRLLGQIKTNRFVSKLPRGLVLVRARVSCCSICNPESCRFYKFGKFCLKHLIVVTLYQYGNIPISCRFTWLWYRGLYVVVKSLSAILTNLWQ